MAENYGTYTAPLQTTSQYDVSLLLSLPEDQRLMAMKKLGAVNVEPRLPHSPALKVKKTGVIFPWLEILAEQTDKMVCCDLDGNEDEAVWGPKVINHEVSNRELTIMAQAQALQKQVVQQIQAPHEASKQGDVAVRIDTSTQSEYEKQGVIPLKEIQMNIQNLREQLYATNSDNSRSVE